MSRSQFHSKELFLLRHAWLNLLDERMTTGRINQVDCKPNLKPAKAEEWLPTNKPQRTYLLIRRAVRLDSQTLMYQTPALTCKKRIRIISFPILVHGTTARHRCSARLAINSP